MTAPKRPTPAQTLAALRATLSVTRARQALPGLTPALLRAHLDAALAALGGGTAAEPAPARRKKGKTAGAEHPELFAGPAAATAPPAAAAGGVIIAHCDGAARGNPGPGAAGVVLTGSDGCETPLGEYLGPAVTNNQAEYRAVILALTECRRRGAARVNLFLDSELVARQLEGRYRVKDAKLIPLHAQADRLRRSFAAVEIRHVPRERNRGADAAANAALDRALGKQ